MAPTRRYTDTDELELSTKVALLDKDVQNLRVEFDFHRKQSVADNTIITDSITQLDAKINEHLHAEEIRHQYLNDNVLSIQTSISSLREELREPLEIYKTARYSVQASKFIRNGILFILPLFTGIIGSYYYLIGYLHK